MKIDKVCFALFALLSGVHAKTANASSTKDKFTELLQDTYLGEIMKNIEEDFNNIKVATDNQDHKGQYDVLESYSKNRKTLKEKGADSDILVYLDNKVEEILTMGQEDEDVEEYLKDEEMKETTEDMFTALLQDEYLGETMKNIEEDFNNIKVATDNQDHKGQHDVLKSYSNNRNTLREKGADNDILAYLDNKLEEILIMGQEDEEVEEDVHKEEMTKDMLSQLIHDPFLGETVKNIEKDINDIKIAKINKDRKGTHAALESLYNNRKTLKEKTANDDIIEYLDDMVDGILTMDQ